MTTQKVIFLDFDGPMIPWRAYWLSQNNGVARVFDPIAVGMVSWLAKHAPAKLVISSSWAFAGNRKSIEEVFAGSHLSLDLLHDDWMTPRYASKPGDIRPRAYKTRAEEVAAWLAKHPEITHWVAFDDDPVPEPGGIIVSFEDGIQMAHFEKAKALLGIAGKAVP